MAVYFHNGGPLIVDGKVAVSEDCCDECDDVIEPCVNCPSYDRPILRIQIAGWGTPGGGNCLSTGGLQVFLKISGTLDGVYDLPVTRGPGEPGGGGQCTWEGEFDGPTVEIYQRNGPDEYESPCNVLTYQTTQTRVYLIVTRDDFRATMVAVGGGSGGYPVMQAALADDGNPDEDEDAYYWCQEPDLTFPYTCVGQFLGEFGPTITLLGDPS